MKDRMNAASVVANEVVARTIAVSHFGPLVAAFDLTTIQPKFRERHVIYVARTNMFCQTG